MILAVGALQELLFAFASFEDKPLGNRFFGFEFHIVILMGEQWSSLYQRGVVFVNTFAIETLNIET